MKTKQNIRRLTAAALGTALVCVCTRAIQIPIPLGYAHLGDFSIYEAWVKSANDSRSNI